VHEHAGSAIIRARKA